MLMTFIQLQNYLYIPRIINRAKTIWFGWILVVCLLFILFLYLAVNFPVNNMSESKIITMHRLNRELHGKQQQLVAAKSMYKNQTTQIDNSMIHKMRPQYLSHWLTQLMALANAQNLEFDTIKPLAQEEAQELRTQPIQIVTSGHYLALLSFLQQLPAIDAVNTLGEFILQPSSSGVDATSEHILQLTMTLNLLQMPNTVFQ